jgi:DNA helicase IV
MLEFAADISKADKELLQFLEERLSLTVSVIREVPSKNNINLRQTAEHIQELKEEIKCASERDLPSLFYQLNLQHNLAKRMAKETVLPDCDAPFFAYMALEDERGKVKHYFLGHVSFIDTKNKIRILDWKKAPLAQLFYQYSEGEEYYLERPEGDLSGTLAAKVLVTISKGRLLRVERAGHIFIKEEQCWKSHQEVVIDFSGGEGAAIRELPFGTGYTNEQSCELLGLLDQTQYRLIQSPSDRPLLIIGGAGSGKTTVALHRLAVLCEKRIHFPNQVMVIVPHQGLIYLSKRLLESIGQGKIKIRTADEWFLAQCQRVFSHIPFRIAKETPPLVSIVKRHPALLKVIDLYVEQYKQQLQNKVTSLDFQNKSILATLDELLAQAIDELERFKLTELKRSAADMVSHLYALLTNRSLLQNLVELSAGAISNLAIEQTIDRVTKQLTAFGERDEVEHTIHSELGFFDAEDCALLLYLQRELQGEVAVQSYKHLVLDEAQELATCELNILGEAIREQGQVTVAGDGLQQIDPAHSFISWQQVLADLGVDIVEPEELKISYRSPQHIIDMAYKVLGPLAPSEKPHAKKQGFPVKITQTQHLAHTALELYAALEKLFEQERGASVAIICHQLESAKMLFSQLRELQNVRLVEDSDFSFKAGIDITTVEQIRGLEFDYVIIPDASVFSYPETDNARKRLHLAITRAIHQVWILYSQEPSPLLV